MADKTQKLASSSRRMQWEVPSSRSEVLTRGLNTVSTSKFKHLFTIQRSKKKSSVSRHNGALSPVYLMISATNIVHPRVLSLTL